jgi:hypothetical protein
VRITDMEGRPELEYTGPGRIQTGVTVPAYGDYELWLEGSVDSRPLHVVLDGRVVGEPSTQSGGDGNAIYVSTLKLTSGHHDIELARYGGGWRPGSSAGTVIDGVVLEPVAAEHETVQTLGPSAWRSLCGRSLDWVEVLGAS